MQQQYNSARAEKIAEARSLLSRLKAKPCMDCGGSFPTPSMQFDHRDPSTKRHNVSKFATNGAIEGMLAEIEKCDLVCANCHAARTAEQRRLGLITGGTRRRIDVAASRPGHRRLDATSARRALSIAMQRRRPVGPPPGYESLSDAARRYGVSDRTLRRRIEEGEIEAERVSRPQGSVLFVKLPPDAAPVAALDGNAESDQEGESHGDQGALAILDALLRANAETMERQSDQIAALRERVGRAEAERDAAQDAAKAARSELEAAREEAAELRERLARRRWWWPWSG